MKKYLIALIPFICGSIFSIIYNNLQPQDWTHPNFPWHKTPGMLHYLASGSFIFGIVLSILFFIFILMEDIFSFVDKKLMQRRLKKMK
jgi:hypothetical protein